MRVVVIGSRTNYRYFAEYCDPMIAALKARLVLYEAEEEETMMMELGKEEEETRFIFIQRLPSDRVLESLPLHHVLMLNTEQLFPGSQNVVEVEKAAEKGIVVLDYDQWQSRLVVPHVYLPSLEDGSTTREMWQTIPKTYDVAICTNNSVDRHKIVDRLCSLGIQVRDVYGFGEERDRMIAEARVLLNVRKHRNYCTFEHMRCTRWIMAGMPVVSESGESDTELDLLDFITSVPYDGIVEAVQKILNNFDVHKNELAARLDAHLPTILCERQALFEKEIAALSLSSTPAALGFCDETRHAR